MGVKKENMHGMSGTKTYHTWLAMKARCGNPNNMHYRYYGGRGIKVCDRWKDFKKFYSDMGTRPKGCTIERMDSDGNYTPENCVWASRKDQIRNRGNTVTCKYLGVERSLAEWCEIFGAKYKLVHQRMKRGISFEEAITRPSQLSREPTSLVFAGTEV